MSRILPERGDMPLYKTWCVAILFVEFFNQLLEKFYHAVLGKAGKFLVFVFINLSVAIRCARSWPPLAVPLGNLAYLIYIQSAESYQRTMEQFAVMWRCFSKLTFGIRFVL